MVTPPPRPDALPPPPGVALPASGSWSGQSGAPEGNLGRRFGPYIVDDVIGAGGMGAVYRVHHEATGGAYALKVILTSEIGSSAGAEEVARFRREAEVLARIDVHPNVVRIFSFGESDGTYYAVMELVEGQTLSDRYRGPAPVADAVRIVSQIGAGIEHAHRHGVVHRDLKPDNVIIDASGTPRILDFGLAFDVRESSRRLTRTDEVVGTPAFMAPEQVDGGTGGFAVSAATDVYGLGAVLYVLLTGERPFRGDAITAMSKVLTETPEAPRSFVPDLPLELEAICLKALAKDPPDRYPSAAELVADLARFGRGEEILARPSSGMLSVVRRIVPGQGRPRRGALVGVGVVMALLAGAIGVVVTTSIAEHREAEARRLAERRDELHTAFDRAFERACGGDLAGLAEARGIGNRLAPIVAEAERERLAERAKVVLVLEELAHGDAPTVAVRMLRLDDPPWPAHRRALVPVLLAAGRLDALATLLDRSSGLLADVGAAEGLVAAIVGGDVRVQERVLASVLTQARRAARDAGDRETRRRWQALEAGLRARRLEAVLLDEASSPGRVAEVASALAPLLPAIGWRVEGISDAAVERLIALSTGHEIEMDLSVEELVSILDVAASVLDVDDPKAAMLIRSLQAAHLEAIQMQDDADRERALAIAMILQRLGEWPWWWSEIHLYAPRTDALDERARMLLDAEDVTALDPIELVAFAAVLLERRFYAILEGKSQTPALGLVARRDALQQEGRWLARVLERERLGSDLPGWALAWVGRQLDISEVWSDTDPAAQRHPLRELVVGELATALDVDSTPTAVIDALFRRGLDRERTRPSLRRDLKMLIEAAWWLHHRGGDASDEEARRLVDELLELVAEREHLGVIHLADSQRNHLGELVYWTGRAIAASADGHDGDAECAEGVRMEAYLERASAVVDPVSSNIMGVRALHCARHGEIADARRILRAVPLSGRERRRPMMLYVHAVQVLFAAGRFEDAAVLIEDTLDFSPEAIGVAWMQSLADIWTQVGHPDRAAAVLAARAELVERERRRRR